MKRLLGFLIFLKTIIPILLVAILFISSYMALTSLQEIVDEASQSFDEKAQLVQARVDTVKAEAARILGEVQKIRDSAATFSTEVGKMISPLKSSLYGLQNSMKTIAQALEGFINGLVRAVNKIPGVKLKSLDLKSVFKIPAFVPELPEFDLDISPDFSAVQELAVISEEMADEALANIQRIAEVLAFWWRMLRIFLILIMLWLMLAVIGYVVRTFARLDYGWRLMIGKAEEARWELL